MSKKSKNVIIILACMITLVCALVAILPGYHYSTKLNTTVTVKDGKVDPASARAGLPIGRSGKYVFTADWWLENDPGFVTALSISDETGREVFSVSGQELMCDSVVMDLQAGIYTCEFEFLADAASYAAYCQAHFPEEDIADFDDSFVKDGTWDMVYSIEAGPAYRSGYIIGIMAGILFGILFIALVAVLARKDTTAVSKYDERQIAMQGKAAKYAFYTMLVYSMAAAVILDLNLVPVISPAVLLFAGAMLGAGVMVTYALLKDAYFKMNESKRTWIIAFGIITVFNVFLGIISLARNEILADGILRISEVGNLLCGVLMAYILILCCVKNIIDRREEE